MELVRTPEVTQPKRQVRLVTVKRNSKIDSIDGEKARWPFIKTNCNQINPKLHWNVHSQSSLINSVILSQILFISFSLASSQSNQSSNRFSSVLVPNQSQGRNQIGGFASSRLVYSSGRTFSPQDPRRVLASTSSTYPLVSRRTIFSRDTSTERPSSRSSASISSLQKELNNLRQQLEFALEDSSHTQEVVIGSPCVKAKDCTRHIDKSHCRIDTFTCSCLPQHVEYNTTTCLSPSLLGYDCLVDAQCRQKVPNSQCLSGVCSCEPKFVAHRKDKCLQASRIDEYCLNDRQCQLSDRHAYCRWKIPQIYGHCKCPPNYMILSTFDGLNNKTTRCAPRLGDSCLSDEECLLSTKNSRCSEQIDHKRPEKRTNWQTSNASNKRCRCSEGFEETPDQLSCISELQVEVSIEGLEEHKSSTISDGQLSLSAVGSMDAKNQYEIVIPSSSSTKKTDVDFSMRPTSEIPTTTETTTIETPISRKNITKPTDKRSVSLGKSCTSGDECRARDPHSDCINGTCECIKPTSSCSSNSTGCHKDTFQCRNGQCISWYFVCDNFKNCDDGSDEDECLASSCPPEAFQCSDGSCLALGKLCNGVKDCRDGSDEFQCLPKLSGHSDYGYISDGVGVSHGNCHPRSFACDNGQCLPAHVFCNAVEDCADGSDELDYICERGHHSQAINLDIKHNNLTLVNQMAVQNQVPDLELEKNSSRMSRPAIGKTPTQLQVSLSEPRAPTDSPLVKTDRWSIEKMLASLNLRPRTPENRGRKVNLALGGKNVMANQERRSRLLQSFRQAPLLECPKSTFTCRNGKCRSTAILCSGVDGCGDKSDEDRCQVCLCEAPN